MYAEAFLDDPAWLGIGPAREARRRRLLSRYYRVAVKEALDHGGPSWYAARDRSVLGAAVTFADGLGFPPPGAAVREGPAFLAAGPGPALRGARADAVFKRARPREPHLYLWLLAAHPSAQRQGVGRALMHKVLEEAAKRQSPIYVETTKAENVPYYGSFGFELTGEAGLPGEASVWFLWREADPSA